MIILDTNVVSELVRPRPAQRVASWMKRQPVGTADAQIAAVCRAVSATLVTRNVKDFERTGVDIVNPWETESAPER